jgi:hypothetical protein
MPRAPPSPSSVYSNDGGWGSYPRPASSPTSIYSNDGGFTNDEREEASSQASSAYSDDEDLVNEPMPAVPVPAWVGQMWPYRAPSASPAAVDGEVKSLRLPRTKPSRLWPNKFVASPAVADGDDADRPARIPPRVPMSEVKSLRPPRVPMPSPAAVEGEVLTLGTRRPEPVHPSSPAVADGDDADRPARILPRVPMAEVKSLRAPVSEARKRRMRRLRDPRRVFSTIAERSDES